MQNKVKLVIADIGWFRGKEVKILSQITPCYAEKYRSTKIRQDAEQELTAGYLL